MQTAVAAREVFEAVTEAGTEEEVEAMRVVVATCTPEVLPRVPGVA